MVSNSKKTLLVVGGCRSGKSRFAEHWAGLHFRKKIYVATSVPGDDDEMRQRISHHRMTRGNDWFTLEEPVAIAEILRKKGSDADVFLVDCLTLWLTNLLLADLSDEKIRSEMDILTEAIDFCPVSVVLVANEVGLGIVPEAALARRFRDLAGWCNQKIASCCQEVVFMAAGLPLYLKHPCPETKVLKV